MAEEVQGLWEGRRVVLAPQVSERGSAAPSPVFFCCFCFGLRNPHSVIDRKRFSVSVHRALVFPPSPTPPPSRCLLLPLSPLADR